ncbi:nucleoside/nucleotide kinase family protein [Nocardioides mangrovicus]|uniref:Nucleoside/nucleotide kinase family protein n=1 Tax=Nocardioides mangrovicus TaxID=2478913 RepID=A0A3L8NWN2_9ACTN|nr:nucleoside/nucleotide kinase family protein [Nocardioides mangrovicus]RLV47565.1 nucleoside/nucleotide kinase family protein [Nocardioides mangrovicus]
MNGADLVARLRRLRGESQRPRLVIGIAGAPGAGKTTLALDLVARLGPDAVHLPMDGFHLADVELERLGRRDRKGAPDTFDPGGLAALLARVGDGEPVWAPAFDRDLEQPVAQSIAVLPEHEIVVVEGNYLLLPESGWAAVRSRLDEAWYLRLDEPTRRQRLVARHVRFGKAPDAAEEWVARVDEPNAGLVDRSAPRADLVIDLGR